MFALARKAVAAYRRDRQLPVAALAVKIYNNATAYALARVHLRALTHVGPRPRCFGRPHVDNAGRLVVGSDFAVGCAFGTVHLATGHRGAIEIGDAVTVNYGTSISASTRVRIGNRVKIGPYCVLSDTDLPLPLAAEGADGARPIEIGDDVWLAGRVTVLPGVRVGRGAVVAAGSVVTSDIPDGAIASGAPAKVLRVVRVRGGEHAPVAPMSGTRLVPNATAETGDAAVEAS